MSIFEVGRLCVKKVGRETGKQCVIIDVIDKNYVLVTGPREVTGVKRRRVNIDHLSPLETKLTLKKGVDDKEVIKAMKKTMPEKFPAEKVEEKSELKTEEVKKPGRTRKKEAKKETKQKTDEEKPE